MNDSNLSSKNDDIINIIKEFQENERLEKLEKERLEKQNLIRIKLSKTQSISIDWLTVCFDKLMPDYSSFEINKLNQRVFVFSPNCYIIDTCNKKTVNGFNRVCELFIENKYIGLILFDSIYPNAFNKVHYIVENSLLYTQKYLYYISLLICKNDFKISYVVRLDICVDYAKMNLLDFINKFDRCKNIKKKGKADYDVKHYADKSIKFFSLGSSSSDKFIRLYNKTEKLKKEPKPYILEYWDNNNFQYKDNIVERLEITLKTSLLHNIDLYRLCEPDYLASICSTHLKNYFEFESTYKQNNKQTKHDVTPIDLTFEGFTVNYLKEIKSLPQESLNALKSQLKRMYNQYKTELLFNDSETDLHLINPLYFESILISIERLIELNPLLKPYYIFNKNNWDKEFDNNNIAYKKIV